MEKLWRRERFLFWGTAVGVGVLTISLRSFGGAIGLQLFFPVLCAFILTGLLSLARFASASRRAVELKEGWLAAAAWGSAGWWVITLAIFSALLVVAINSP